MKAMPTHEEHCLHSERRYGVRGDDIHSWIDEPSQISGGGHRKYRHDLNSLDIAIQVFKGKYDEETIRNIFLDHLRADSEESRKPSEGSNVLSMDNSFGHTQEKLSTKPFGIVGFLILSGLFGLFSLALIALLIFLFPLGDVGNYYPRQSLYVLVGFSFVCFALAFLIKRIKSRFGD